MLNAICGESVQVVESSGTDIRQTAITFNFSETSNNPSMAAKFNADASNPVEKCGFKLVAAPSKCGSL
jgi:hypothetical protein